MAADRSALIRDGRIFIKNWNAPRRLHAAEIRERIISRMREGSDAPNPPHTRQVRM